MTLESKQRQASGEIGLHRTYFDPKYYSELPSLDAEEQFQRLQSITKLFLDDMRVDPSIIEIIQRTPSSKLKIYKGRPETSAIFGEESPFLEEWNTSKCGSVDEDVAVAWCANSMINHYVLNVSMVEGWRERYEKDPYSELTNHLPGICEPLLDRAFDLVGLAAENKDVRAMLEPKSAPLAERFKCVAKAENREVFSFFKTIKESDEAFALFDVSAEHFVRRKYGI